MTNLNMKINACECDEHWHSLKIMVQGEKDQYLNQCLVCGNTWMRLEKTGMRPYPYEEALASVLDRRN